MTYGTTVMFIVAALLMLVGGVMLLRLRAATITERQTYAFRMVGIMLASAGVVLAFSAWATWQWTVSP